MKQYKSTLPEITLKKTKTEFANVKIGGAKDAEQYIKQFYLDDIEVFESVFILLLNRANNTIGYAKISQGGITESIVDVQLITKHAIESLAKSVILAHNHPSGSLTPSVADKKITVRVKKALEIFNISLLDHLILTVDSYYSFADANNLQ